MKKVKFTILLLALTAFVFAQAPQKPEMVPVAGGFFYMGNDYSPALDEKPEHKVTISSFKISKYEVTFDQFDNFCTVTGYPKPDDAGYGRGKKPVINVSWIGAVKYCNWLSRRYGYEKVYELSVDSMGTTVKSVNWNADGYRLPTEAEWEYVAKGGANPSGYAYPGSNDPKEIAWYKDNSGGHPHDVGTKKENELGVFDILGNAYEWCWDYYDAKYYNSSPEQDPKGPNTGEERVYRGGNFNSGLSFLRVTRRFSLDPNTNSGMIGIRLAQNANAKD